jgi:hypothetical protein
VINRGRTAASGVVIAAVTLAVAWLQSPGGPVTLATGPTVQAEGVLIAIDSQVRSLTISGPRGTQEFYVTPDTVIELGNKERVAFGDLRKFMGVASTVLSQDTGAQQNANYVTLLVMSARGTLPGGVRDRTKPVDAEDGGRR